MTDLHHKANNDLFPAWATFVLDEAYSSCGKMHLTPFSLHQLKREKRNNQLLYFKMLAFNNVLTSQRITIKKGVWKSGAKMGDIVEANRVQSA